MFTSKCRNVLIALVCQLTICAAPVIAYAADVVVGVNMNNPARLAAEQQDAMLGAMKAAGVRVIRAGIAPGDKGVDFARRVYAHGIRLVWILDFGGYQPGAPTRPGRPE